MIAVLMFLGPEIACIILGINSKDENFGIETPYIISIKYSFLTKKSHKMNYRGHTW